MLRNDNMRIYRIADAATCVRPMKTLLLLNLLCKNGQKFIIGGIKRDRIAIPIKTQVTLAHFCNYETIIVLGKLNYIHIPGR